MRIAVVTDAWLPQVNGVVRTWTEVIRQMRALKHEVLVIHPGLFSSVAVPKYPEIRMALFARRKAHAMLESFDPDAIHLVTEGTLGLAGRGYCVKRGIPFTTSYHTQYPKYLNLYYKVPAAMTVGYLRWFHEAAEKTLVPTRAVSTELQAYGFTKTFVWNRGVDGRIFKPQAKDALDLPRPIFLTAGRVAREKNIEAFLNLDLPGSKVVVGDGPARAGLQKRYPDVHWTGYQHGNDLARFIAAGDVFVFPSRTDTFGVAMLEANACGLPVAAYPVTGPIDVVRNGITGVINDDLRTACLEALKLDPADCVAYAHDCTWERCAQTVLDHLAMIQSVQNEADVSEFEEPVLQLAD